MDCIKRVAAILMAISVAVLFPLGLHAEGGTGLEDPTDLEAFLDGVMAVQLEENHVAGAVVTVVKDGELFFAKGYGYADVESRTPVQAETTLFRIGSITKLFTWTAVMQLVEKAKLDLDEDVNVYLDFRIPDTYPQPITLRHLLTHTPGFEDRGFGMGAASPEDLVPLGQWLAENVPARVRPPGQFAAYSNYGATLAGYIVARASGMSYHDYIEVNILNSLRMSYTTSRQPLPEALASHMSGGYRYAEGAYHAEDFELLNVPPAGSISATATDMARFMSAHLRDGRYGEGRILSEDTTERMHSQLFTHDERLNGLAYGFYEMDQNGQQIIGHGGDTFLFHSLLALMPESDVGLFVSYNSVGASELGGELFSAFVDRYYPVTEEAPPMPSEASDWVERATGNYRMLRTSYTTPEKIMELLTALSMRRVEGETVLVSTPFDQDRFVPTEPLVLREIHGEDVIVFRQDSRGDITHAFADSVPVIALGKMAWYEAPPFHYGLLGGSLFLFLTTIIAAPVAFFVNRRRDDIRPQPFAARMGRWVLGIAALLGILLSIALPVILSDLAAVMTGNVPLLDMLLTVPLVIAILTGISIPFAILGWCKRYWTRWGRVHYTLVTVAALAFTWALYFWNMLGGQL